MDANSSGEVAGRSSPRGSSPRKRKNQESRQQQLIDHVEDIILRDGFTRVTMDDLAARVQASKSTLYRISPTKESLVSEVMRRFFENSRELAERQIAAVRSQRERVSVYLTALGHALRRMSRECYDDMMMLPPTRHTYEAHSRIAADRVHGFIEAGVEAHEFRAANAQFIGRAVSLLMDGIQRGELIWDTGLSSAEAYSELGSLILNALSARAPLELPTDTFVPSSEAGPVAPLERKVAFANLGNAGIFDVWEANMRSAAERRGLEFVVADAGFDAEASVRSIRQFTEDGVAAILVAEVDAPVQRPAIVEAMEKGIAVFAVAFGPATCRIDADQYGSGQAAAQAMVDRVGDSMGGRAEILMFNLDDREGIRPRYQAVRDVVALAGPDISLAVDQVGVPQTAEFGYETMREVLRLHPQVNVVIGEDSHVLGALAAIEEAGLDKDPRWLLVGIGGEGRALEKVAQSDSPLRIDVAFALPAIGVIPSRFAEDWIEGRRIPTEAVFNPVVLDTPEAVATFTDDMSEPESLFDAERQDRYLTLLGNTSYAERPVG